METIRIFALVVSGWNAHMNNNWISILIYKHIFCDVPRHFYVHIHLELSCLVSLSVSVLIYLELSCPVSLSVSLLVSVSASIVVLFRGPPIAWGSHYRRVWRRVGNTQTYTPQAKRLFPRFETVTTRSHWGNLTLAPGPPVHVTFFIALLLVLFQPKCVCFGVNLCMYSHVLHIITSRRDFPRAKPSAFLS